MRARRDKPVKLPPSEDDVWLDMLHTEVGKAIAQWLQAGVNLDRQIKSLSLAELKGCAAAAESKWLQLVVARLASANMPLSEKEADAYRAQLFGG